MTRAFLVFNLSSFSQSMHYFDSYDLIVEPIFDIFVASVQYMATQNRHGYELVLYGCRLIYV